MDPFEKRKNLKMDQVSMGGYNDDYKETLFLSIIVFNDNKRKTIIQIYKL